LTGGHPDDPVEVHANSLAHPEDVAKSRQCVEFLREFAQRRGASALCASPGDAR